MDNQFEFIVTDPKVSLKPGKSLQIRSRCMQGVNKRENSRRSIREKKKQGPGKLGEAPRQVVVALPSPTSMPISRIGSPFIQDYPAPRYWANAANSEAQSLLFRAFAYNVADQPLTPLALCVDFSNLPSSSFEWLFSDAAFVQSILFASFTITDLESPNWNGKPGSNVVLHLRKTLNLLNNKIQDGGHDVYQDDSVLYVVVNLVLLAVIHGDWKAGAAHLAGLQRIVQLRGGMKFWQTRSKLHFKIDRLDLAWSLNSGQKPFFLHPKVVWDQAIPASPQHPGMYSLPHSWNYRLANVYSDMQSLSKMINCDARTGKMYPASSLQTVLSSMQSRLIHLSGQLDSTLEELERLTLLALLATNFKLPGRKVPYVWLSERLREQYWKARLQFVKADRTLQIWTLTVVAIAVKGSVEVWVANAWSSIGLPVEWEEIKASLMKAVWIESVHDGRALEVLPELVRV